VKVHIFDVDFTIVGCSTVRAFIFRGLREGLIGPSIGFYAPLLFLRYGIGKSRSRADEVAYPFLKGVARARLDDLAAALFDEVLRQRIDSAVAERIEAALRSGGKAIIASSSFSTILGPLARHLGISDIVASELEFSDGMATGRLAGEPAFGEGKRSRVLAYLRTIGSEPGECAFYSDSHRDLPLLREVGEAVAVNPDGRLRRMARKSGWEIIAAGSGRKEARHA
jgi:HAD superfamily hydrolase (TIGR01490 family)